MKNLSDLKKFLGNNKKSWAILLLILALGIFLRTYHFHDWLRFNFDQTRDAEIVTSALEGKSSLPLLGPKAGGTDFKLGPIFYYFQYISASVLGISPDKMAYPNVFFSILAIPLLFFLLKKYFSTNISLLLTVLFSLSFYAIKYARFSWNPNPVIFFLLLFLYSLLELANPKQNRKLLWAALVGFALGVGVQLHTLFLITASIVFVLFTVYLIKKGRITWKAVTTTILIALILNIPQIISEFQHHGKNTRDFFEAISIKSNHGNSSLAGDILTASICQIQANTITLSAYGYDDFCGTAQIKNQLEKSPNKFVGNSKLLLVAILIVSILLSVGSYVLLIYYFKKETSSEKKIFLALILLTLGIFFLIQVPMANEINVRYFFIEGFMPFVLLGFWLKFIRDKFKYGVLFIALMGALLVGTNVAAIGEYFANPFANVGPERETELENVTLGEEESMANFIVSHSASSNTVYIGGNAETLPRFMRSIVYLTRNINMELIELDKKVPLKSAGSAPYFIIDLFNDSEKAKQLEGIPEEILPENYKVTSLKSFGRFTIFQLTQN